MFINFVPLFLLSLSFPLYFAKYFVSCVCALNSHCVNKLCSCLYLYISFSLPIFGGGFNVQFLYNPKKNIYLYYKYRKLYIYFLCINYSYAICSFTCVYITIYRFISISLTQSLLLNFFLFFIIFL